jgi:hypothetical protein
MRSSRSERACHTDRTFAVPIRRWLGSVCGRWRRVAGATPRTGAAAQALWGSRSWCCRTSASPHLTWVLAGVGDGEEIAGRTQRHARLLVVVAHVVVELALDLPVHGDRRDAVVDDEMLLDRSRGLKNTDSARR